MNRVSIREEPMAVVTLIRPGRFRTSQYSARIVTIIMLQGLEMSRAPLRVFQMEHHTEGPQIKRRRLACFRLITLQSLRDRTVPDIRGSFGTITIRTSEIQVDPC